MMFITCYKHLKLYVGCKVVSYKKLCYIYKYLHTHTHTHLPSIYIFETESKVTCIYKIYNLIQMLLEIFHLVYFNNNSNKYQLINKVSSLSGPIQS